ncbi:MAG: hypothetical protein EA425_04150 [Puniceicoccaceae bacterium]|nr:MAG: hypothetical protein EA425_04150 [Puniceicoccaceae bacterium]
MKVPRSLLCLSALLLAGHLPCAAYEWPVVESTPAQLLLTGDLFGDGTATWVLVDRSTGMYRVARPGPGGEPQGGEARATGLGSIDGVTLWRRSAGQLPALVFAGYDDNQVRMINNPGTRPLTTFWIESSFHPHSEPVALNTIGPVGLAAQNAGETGLTSQPLLGVLSAANHAPAISDPARMEWWRDRPRVERSLDFEPVSVRAARVRQDQEPFHWVFGYREPEGALLEVFHAGHASFTIPLGDAGDWRLAPSLDNSFHHLLFWSVGDFQLQIRSLVPAGGGAWAAASPSTAALGFPIANVLVLPGTGENHLAVTDDETGEVHLMRWSASGFDFVGSLQPVIPGHRYLLLAPDGEGGFLALTGPSAEFPAAGIEVIRGGDFQRILDGPFPESGVALAVTNILLFEREPFVDPEPNLLARRGTRTWTRPAAVASPEMEVVAEVYAGSGFGLTDPRAMTLSGIPSAAQFMLANQVAADMAIAPRAPGGAAEVRLNVSPASGRYDTSILVELTGPPGAQLRYRLGPDRPWLTYGGPFWIYRETILEAYARIPNEVLGTTLGYFNSRIVRRHYRFSVPPERLDSDDDGVPDFVEIAFGLDPVLSGPDASGNGVPDLEEILLGTNPADPANPPDPHLRDPLDARAFFRLDGLVRVYDQGLDPALPQSGSAVRVFGPGRRLLGVGLQPAMGAPGHPRLRIDNLPIERETPLVAVLSDPHFALPGDPEDEARTGREVVAVLPPPALPLPEIDYSYGSGATLMAEVEAWIAAAQAAYLGHERIVRDLNLDPLSTLHAALIESWLEGLLRARGVLAADLDLTLFPARSIDTARQPFSLANWELLTAGNRWRIDRPHTYPASGIFDDFDLAALIPEAAHELREAAGMAPLRAFAEEIYRISALHHRADADTLDLPLDVFRRWIRDEELPAGFATRLSLTVGQLAAARAAAGNLLAVGSPRALVSWVVRLPEVHGEFPGCRTVQREILPGAFVDVGLFDPKGRPFRLATAFPMPPGTLLEITGYERPGGSCGAAGLDVITVTVLEFPPVPGADADGNLLPDAWEEWLTGGTGGDPFASWDGSSYSALQQYLEGTDPTDPASLPGAPPEDLGPPVIRIAGEGSGSGGTAGEWVAGTAGGIDELVLVWNWSPVYASRVRFLLQESETLAGFTTTAIEGQHLGGGQFELSLAVPPEERKFFRLLMQLRD